MKKIFLVSLALGISISITNTVDAYKIEPNAAPYSYSNKLDNQDLLNQAIRKRWGLTDSKNNRDLSTKNSLWQKLAHTLSLRANHVNEQSTTLSRTGELKTVPNYSKRQHTTNNNYARPNSTSVFKARIIDYYVNGGNAGTEVLKDDLILGSEHKVPTYAPNWGSGDAPTIMNIRQAQKTLSGKGTRESWLDASKQRETKKIPQTKYRNFSHPYMSDDPEWEY